MKTIANLKEYRDFIRTVSTKKLHEAVWILSGPDVIYAKTARQKRTLLQMELNYRAAS